MCACCVCVSALHLSTETPLSYPAWARHLWLFSSYALVAAIPLSLASRGKNAQANSETPIRYDARACWGRARQAWTNGMKPRGEGFRGVQPAGACGGRVP